MADRIEFTAKTDREARAELWQKEGAHADEREQVLPGIFRTKGSEGAFRIAQEKDSVVVEKLSKRELEELNNQYYEAQIARLDAQIDDLTEVRKALRKNLFNLETEAEDE